MRVSRIAKESARGSGGNSSGKRSTRLQTRKFAGALNVYVADGALGSTNGRTQEEVKLASANGDDSSELSSLGSGFATDIEDLSTPSTSSEERKRAHSSSITGLKDTTIITHTSQRVVGLQGDPQSNTNAKKARRQPAKRAIYPDGQVEVHPPPRWEEVYEAVKNMRKQILAPVDTMGCETLAEEHASPRDRRFQTLIALMLSSQTKDTVTAMAMRRLQTELSSGLTLESILLVPPPALNELIWAVGFHNNKTRYIKAAALILRDNWNNDIPDTVEGLMSLPGVGPKMAYLCMSAAWGRTEGIGVDIHVLRISNRWGWHKTKTPEETRAALEAWLPRDKWHEINHLLVGFGQTICLPVGRKCGVCDLSAMSLCPSAVVSKKKVSGKGTVKQEIRVESDDVDLKIEDDETLTADVLLGVEESLTVGFKGEYKEGSEEDPEMHLQPETERVDQNVTPVRPESASGLQTPFNCPTKYCL